MHSTTIIASLVVFIGKTMSIVFMYHACWHVANSAEHYSSYVLQGGQL